MIPDWPSLWKRAPGLKPDGLMFSESDGWMSGVREQEVAALCRDKAVEWLVLSGGVQILPKGVGNFQIAPKRENYWEVHTLSGVACVSGVRPSGFGCYSPASATLDEALFTACAAVLDARDAAKAREGK